MFNLMRIVMSAAGVLSLAVCLIAQEKAETKAHEAKKAPMAKKGGILQPQMKVENGTYKEPMGKLGDAVTEPWSSTTVGAAVDGKANAGATSKTVIGEIVDFSCYLQIGKHGEKHRSCAQKCFNAGQPIGLLAENGALYMLMEEEHDPRRDGQTEFRKVATDHAGHIMEVTGTEWSLGGYHALYVHGFVKK